MSYRQNGATLFNPKFTIGETWIMDVLIQDVDGAVVDLTATIDARWRLADDNGILIDAAIGSGVFIDSDPTSGIVHIRITPSMQTGLSPTKPHEYYRHELRLISNPIVGDSTQMRGRVAVLESLFNKYP